MVKGHRIEKFENIKTFLGRIKYWREEDIKCTHHTFFRLSEKQKKLFKCEDIKGFLLEERPVLVGIQYNGNYAIFYKYKEGKFIRIIITANAKASP